jgi:hypothetical protein
MYSASQWLTILSEQVKLPITISFNMLINKRPITIGTGQGSQTHNLNSIHVTDR